MAVLKIERIGGLGGFGLPGSNVKSRGEIDDGALGEADRARIDALFEQSAAARPPSPVRDGFAYRLTRGGETIEVPEAEIPAAVAQSVKDELS